MLSKFQLQYSCVYEILPVDKDNLVLSSCEVVFEIWKWWCFSSFWWHIIPIEWRIIFYFLNLKIYNSNFPWVLIFYVMTIFYKTFQFFVVGYSKPCQPKMEVTLADFFLTLYVSWYVWGGNISKVAGHLLLKVKEYEVMKFWPQSGTIKFLKILACSFFVTN